MRNLFLTITCVLISIFSFAQESETIYVSAINNGHVNDSKWCRFIEDRFQEELLKAEYTVRLVRNEGIFTEEMQKELAFQQSGAVIVDQIRETGYMIGVGQLCVVVVEKIGSTYYIRAKIYDVESGVLKRIASYPSMPDDTETETLDFSHMQKVTAEIIKRLGFNEAEMEEISDAAQTRIDREKDNADRELRNSKNTKIFSTLATSLIPGVGLMVEDHVGEGVAYLVGDIALVGAGVGCLASYNRKKSIMNDFSTSYEEYNRALRTLKSAKIGSYCCFGAAATLYIVNFIRAYIVSNENFSNTTGELLPAVVPTIGNSNIGNTIGVAFNYNF